MRQQPPLQESIERVLGDERRALAEFLGRLEFQSWRQAGLAVICVVIAAALSLLPEHPGLESEGRYAFFILLLAAGLWVSEAIPAYAVALLVVALEIMLLGDMGRSDHAQDWSRFVAPWASPLLWLFIGGFVLGQAATRTGLDRWLAHTVLTLCGATPRRTLFGLMSVGFILSMFMSNTAAAAMLLAIALPIARSCPPGDRARKAVILGVAVATNLGGMATLNGSPPNAIAAGALGGLDAFDFARWIMVGLPPALLLFAGSYALLVRLFPAATEASLALPKLADAPRLPAWQHLIVIVVFAATVLLWMTSSWHRIPSPIISFLPITLFSAFGILRSEDVRALPWDVLMLLLGGLALGLAVNETGLASWIVGMLPISGFGRIALALAAAYAAVVLSNFMSNTAATNILVPIGVALGAGSEALVAVPIALSASGAMCLAISTPPNAMAYATGELETRDLLVTGLALAVVTPAVVVTWCALML